MTSNGNKAEKDGREPTTRKSTEIRTKVVNRRTKGKWKIERQRERRQKAVPGMRNVVITNG